MSRIEMIRILRPVSGLSVTGDSKLRRQVNWTKKPCIRSDPEPRLFPVLFLLVSFQARIPARSASLKPPQFEKLATNMSGFTADPPVPNMELAVPLRRCAMPMVTHRWGPGKAAAFLWMRARLCPPRMEPNCKQLSRDTIRMAARSEENTSEL